MGIEALAAARPPATRIDWKDLAGKKVGGLTGGTLERFYSVALRDHGIDPTKIEQVNFATPGPDYMQSLESGVLDAFAAFEPFTATAAVEGWATYAPTEPGRNSFGGANRALGANTDFLARQPDVAVAMLKALGEVTQFPKSNPDAWAELTASRVNAPVPVAHESIRHPDLDPNLEANVKKLAAYMLEAELGQKDHRAVVSDCLDYGPLSRATGKPAVELGGQ
jgi:ABC-type nitrate/sulfonate/bicarbonate transport system substrate-binding protein